MTSRGDIPAALHRKLAHRWKHEYYKAQPCISIVTGGRATSSRRAGDKEHGSLKRYSDGVSDTPDGCL